MPSILTRRNLWLAVLLLAAAACSGSKVADALPATATAEGPAAFCPDEQFSDTCPSDWFYGYVMDLTGTGAISGYADGTFRPYNTITRAQAMKVVVLAAELSAPLPDTPTFADVPANHPFFAWVETGAAHGVAGGYACGGAGEPCPGQYFRPNANINRGQVAKMIVNAFGWGSLHQANPTFRDVPSTSPYYGFVERAAAEGVTGGYLCGSPGESCPGVYFRPGATSLRAHAAKMVELSRRRRATNTPTPSVTPTTPVPSWTGTPATATPSHTPTPTGTHTATRTRTATRTATRTPTRTPTAGSTTGCPMFPANNIWNRNIAALPTHVRSNAYITSIGLGTSLHADFGSGLWDGGPIGIPYISVPGTQPRVPVSFEYDDESDPGPYPIPTNAPIEGGPNSTGDRHVIVVDRDNCVLYETFSSYPHADGSWSAGSGAKWQLTSNALRPDTWTSADAAGLPILPGLVRYDEVASGAIRHALRFTASRTQRAYLWPARHYASTITDPNVPPMGLRVRLKANVDISGYPQQMRVILQAFKDYGLFLADNGSNWYISGVPDERWDNTMLRLIRNLHGSDFEAVDESGLMVDPNSGESR